MRFRVRLTTKACRDVDGVLRWFHEQRATASGNRWLARLWSTIDTLERDQHRCSLAAEANDLGQEIRELLFGKRRAAYRILFLIQGRTVQILHIRHTARDRVTLEDL